MKLIAWYGGALALALLLIFAGSMAGGASRSTVAPTISAQAPPVQPAQPVEDNNEFPWGLLGLVGLVGLAGLRRQPEPVRQETGKVQPTVGVYEKKN